MSISSKKFCLCFAVASALTLSHSATASELTGCAAKEQEIQQQIEYAKAHNNSNRLSGLETALSKLRSNCTDASLQKERREKVEEKQRKVREREEELKEAQQTGREEKIEKKRQKLAEAQQELATAKSELNQ